MLLFLHIFQKQTCCYLKSCFEGKQKSEMCLSGDMQGRKFLSIRESLLLRNLWWCFWCLAIMQRVFAEWHLISNIGLRLSRLQRSWVQKELVLLHQEKEASRCALVIWVSASARDSCSRLVMLRKWSGPFNWGTLRATTAARRLSHCTANGRLPQPRPEKYRNVHVKMCTMCLKKVQSQEKVCN